MEEFEEAWHSCLRREQFGARRFFNFQRPFVSSLLLFSCFFVSRHNVIMQCQGRC
jgi:hypothetical protein